MSKMDVCTFCDMYLTSQGFHRKQTTRMSQDLYRWEYKIPSNRHAIIAYTHDVGVDERPLGECFLFCFLLDSKQKGNIYSIDTQDEAIGALDVVIDILSILEDEKILPILSISENNDL